VIFRAGFLAWRLTSAPRGPADRF